MSRPARTQISPPLASRDSKTALLNFTQLYSTLLNFTQLYSTLLNFTQLSSFCDVIVKLPQFRGGVVKLVQSHAPVAQGVGVAHCGLRVDFDQFVGLRLSLQVFLEASDVDVRLLFLIRSAQRVRQKLVQPCV